MFIVENVGNYKDNKNHSYFQYNGSYFQLFSSNFFQVYIVYTYLFLQN